MMVIGVLLLFFGSLVGPMYLGQSQTTVGTIVASPDYHPTITYEVSGVTYTTTLSENGFDRRLGQEITVVYNPRHPQQAATPFERNIALIFGGVALGCMVAGLIMTARALTQYVMRRRVMVSGQVIRATVTGIHQTLAHVGPWGITYSTTLTCEWTSPDGATRTFRSVPARIKAQIGLPDDVELSLPVYIDRAHPGRYYVDDTDFYLDMDLQVTLVR